MRRLLLDVGNSRLKWALAVDAVLGPSQALAHAGAPAAAVATFDADRVDSIWIANVTGPQHAAALGNALRGRYGIAPDFAAPEAERLGLRSAYANPQRLGVDRWLGLLAAWSRVRGAVCVASCGTALTFDAIDAQGQHLGGVIAPGLLATQQAVLSATRFAASDPDIDYDDGLGRDTEACVRQGALHACAGLVDRLAARQPEAACILTGGDAALLHAHLCGRWVVAPDIVLEGLMALASTGESTCRVVVP